MTEHISTADLKKLHSELQSQYEQIKQQKLALDITRGKPSAEQLTLSNAINHILPDSELVFSGTDLRNYGGLEGIPAARKLGAEMLGVKMEETIAAGNSSLQLMYQAISFAVLFGPAEGEAAWLSISKQSTPSKFICPVPGYDRHFAICEELGIEMIAVQMNAAGPDMDQVESLLKKDPSIKGMWCVPKYSNPDGCVYSADTVERIAKLGLITAANNNTSFRVFWDNAYAVHDLIDNPPVLTNIMDTCRKHGTEDSVLQFASTSKITFAGSGLAWMGASERNIKSFLKHLGISTIGADKVNQARHVKFLPNMNAVHAQMKKHTAILKPRFDCVLNKLEKNLGANGNSSDIKWGSWKKPQGGYFVSFDTQPGLATTVVQLANDAGVKLTPAGSTHPYKKDPDNKTIRLAPSFPTLVELDKAMDVFVLCVKLATINKQLS